MAKFLYGPAWMKNPADGPSQKKIVLHCNNRMSVDFRLAKVCLAIEEENKHVRDQNISAMGFQIESDCLHDSRKETFMPSYIIAVEKETIFIFFRGSRLISVQDWLTNLHYLPVNVLENTNLQEGPSLKVHGGYWNVAKEHTLKILRCINTVISRQRDKKNMQVIFAGHSKGGAHALSVRTFWVYNKATITSSFPILKDVGVRVVTFGSPLVLSVPDGDYSVLCQVLDPKLNAETRAYVTSADIVPRLLGKKSASGEMHLRVEVQSNNAGSLITGLVGTGCMTVALTAATGGMAALAALVCGYATFSQKLKQGMIEQVLRVRESSEVQGYVCVGEFRFLPRPGSTESMQKLFGPDAHSCLELPRWTGVNGMIDDHLISSYVSCLSRQLPVLTIETLLCQAESATAALVNARAAIRAGAVDGAALNKIDTATASLRAAAQRACTCAVHAAANQSGSMDSIESAARMTEAAIAHAFKTAAAAREEAKEAAAKKAAEAELKARAETIAKSARQWLCTFVVAAAGIISMHLQVLTFSSTLTL
jgi:hypothetical protein